MLLNLLMTDHKQTLKSRQTTFLNMLAWGDSLLKIPSSFTIIGNRICFHGEVLLLFEVLSFFSLLFVRQFLV